MQVQVSANESRERFFPLGRVSENMQHLNVLIVLRYEMWIVTGGLAVLVGYRLLTSGINTRGLLDTKDPSQSYSPARLQLLLITFGCAVWYGCLCIQANAFVEVPRELREMLGGSNVLYVARKFFQLSKANV